ncbi:unnamed protein product [Durusdinium trenchii]|uniref:Uncharacterized protein n=1 Tax=Durusdinium trenchii TaxID=1381693 RepID=A0ABP0M585_9DINO
MTTVERKEHIATWDGDASRWLDYVKRVRLQYERTEPKKRCLLGAELASRLTGKAWDITSAEVDHSRLQRADGAAYLLSFLEERLCKTPIPDVGQRLEEFFMKLRRQPGASMTEWATSLRESYRRLQRAMARQRQQNNPGSEVAVELNSRRPSASSPTPAQRSDRTTPQARRDAPVTFPDIPEGGSNPGRTGQVQETNEEPNDHEGYEELPQSEHGWSEQRWTADEWRQWQRDRWQRQEDDDTSSNWWDQKEETIRWEQFEFGEVQILPQEILGWLLLRRSGLPASARLSVLSAINNRLDLDTMERAMRDQEEELLVAEANRSRGDLHRPRRSFWVEQDSQWGLLGDLETEEVDDSAIYWVGDRLPQDVYPVWDDPSPTSTAWSTWAPDGQELSWQWMDDDFYAQDAEGIFWSWTETKEWMDAEECAQATPNDSEAIFSAFAAFQDKMRSFRDSRKLNYAKQHSRGFYPFSMFKGKSKGKGKKGKPKGVQASPSSTSSALANFQKGKGSSGSTQRPGHPEYRGCFICGSKDHDFRGCPKRRSETSTSNSSSTRPNYFSNQIFVVLPVEENEQQAMTATEDTTAALAAVAVEFPGHAVIDLGATESLASLEALQEIMNLRLQNFGHEEIVVHEETKRFKFGNGDTQKATSFIELPQTIDGTTLTLGVHAIDAPGVPLLLSVRTLRKMGASIDTELNRMQLRRFSDAWIPLKQSANEHLLLDMTRDWYHLDEPSVSAGAYMELFDGPEWDMWPDERVCEESFESQLHDAVPVHDMSMHEEFAASSQHVFCESLEEGDVVDKCVTEFASPDDPSSSSMHFGARAIVTLAAASTVLPLVHHGILSTDADQTKKPGCFAQGGCGEQSSCREGQIIFPEVQEGSDSNAREIRFLEGDRTEYVPAYGATGVYRQAGPLPPDVTTVTETIDSKRLEEEPLYRENLNVKSIGQTGAEESLRKKLQELEAKKAKNPPRLRPGGYKPNDAEMPATHASAAKGTQRVSPDQKKAMKRENDKGPEEAYDGERMGILSKPQQELLQGVVEEFMEEVFLDAGRTALRVGLPAHDLSSKKGVLEIKEMISRWKPKVAWFSLPCGPYSPIQELFNEKDEKAMQRSLERKKKSKKLIKNGLEVATHQLECGGEVAWEWPTNNRGWNLQPVRAFWQRLESSGDLHIARADGCAFDVKDEKTDLPIKKPWTIKTTSRTLTQAVSRTCPGHLVHPEHQECLGGGLARKSGFYPKKFCQAVLRAIREMTDVGAQGVLPAYPVFDTRDMDIEEKEVKKKRVTPLSEVERKGVEKMLERLRKRTGHPSNAALSGRLRHRGAHPEVIDMASRHQCPECQELRAAPLNPALSIEKSEMLWETLVIDNMGFTVDDTTYHYMAMIDEGGDVHPWQAIAHACQAHNQFERVEGYSPYQWAFGRQPTLTGRMHDSDLDMPYWTSVQVPGSSMMKNLKIRVQAQQAFLRHQSQELMSRAKNAKTRRQQVFLPGDLVCFKRVKPPAQSQAHLRLPHKLWRWYGPARVLASETRTDAKGMERKPSSIIWLVSQGRLKRCSPEQLRHASAREQAIAEGMSSPTTTWTFHSLAQSLWKGEYEILDDYLLPEDLVSRGAPKTPRNPRGSSSSGIQSEPRSTGVDLGRLISDPSYEPQPMATGEGRKLPELFEQPLFKKQRRQHGASDDELLATSFLADDGSFCNPNLACAIELPLPSKSSEWRSLKRNAEAYFVKKLKGAEVKWHELSEAKKKEFDAAKQAEVSQWLAASAVKKDLDFVQSKTDPLGQLQSEINTATVATLRAANKLVREAFQALAECDQELMFTRLAWAEFCGVPVNLKKPSDAVKQVVGGVVVDAKALYDVLLKRDLNSSGAGLKDKFTALEVLCLLESLESNSTVVRWVHSNAQLADALTKPLPLGVLQKSLIEGSWTLGYDPDFTSAKKLRKKQGTSCGSTLEASHGQGFWGILESEVDRSAESAVLPEDWEKRLQYLLKANNELLIEKLQNLTRVSVVDRLSKVTTESETSAYVHLRTTTGLFLRPTHWEAPRLFSKSARRAA